MGEKERERAKERKRERERGEIFMEIIRKGKKEKKDKRPGTIVNIHFQAPRTLLIRSRTVN